MAVKMTYYDSYERKVYKLAWISTLLTTCVLLVLTYREGRTRHSGFHGKVSPNRLSVVVFRLLHHRKPPSLFEVNPSYTSIQRLEPERACDIWSHSLPWFRILVNIKCYIMIESSELRKLAYRSVLHVARLRFCFRTTCSTGSGHNVAPKSNLKLRVRDNFCTILKSNIEPSHINFNSKYWLSKE